MNKKARNFILKEITIRILAVITITLLSVLFVSAATGLCFDPDNGLCTDGVESSNCISEGGEFNTDKCSEGCCSLGDRYLFITSRTCEIESRNFGFQYPTNFQYLEEDSCYALSQASVKGACLLGGDYEKNCRYTTFDQCPTGDFYEGISCTDPSLNTICSSTSDTICYDEDVYTIDSCGNPNQKTKNCDYGSGSICRAESSTKADCKDLNCVDSEGVKRKNGEKWCVGADTVFSSSGDDSAECGTQSCSNCYFGYKGASDGTWRIRLPSGVLLESGFKVDEKQFTKRGLDADCCSPGRPSYTGPSDPTAFSSGQTYRVTSQGKTYNLKPTGWQSCSGPGIEGAVIGTGNTITGKQVAGDDPEAFSNVNVGSEFYRQYCINGEVKTEPCGTMRSEVCEAGECVINPWSSCFDIAPDEDYPLDTSWRGECEDSPYCEVWDALDCVSYGVNSSVTVTSRGSTNQVGTTDYCGSQRDSHVNLSTQAGVNGNGGAETQSPLMADLRLSTCVPIIPGGVNFWPSSSSASSSSETFCESQGTITKEFHFDHDGGSFGNWWVKSGESSSEYINTIVVPPKYGNMGLFHLIEEDWTTPFTTWAYKLLPNWWTSPSNNSVFYPLFYKLSGRYYDQRGGDAGPIIASLVNTNYESYVDPMTLRRLKERCNLISDCGEKSNWQGKGEGEEYEWYMYCTSPGSSNNKDTVDCTFKFECPTWEAPRTGECDLCNPKDEGGLPCTEYKCRSIAQSCEFSSEGFCVSSNDHTPPSISASISPPSPIPPFTPVEITVNTNELATCRFNLGDSGGTYDEMSNSFGGEWATKHKIRLNLPGQREGRDDLQEYELITKDGRYEIFVRCIDTAGNPNIAAKLVSFEVMDTPDTIPPIITSTSFVPASGSAIKYNTTSKKIEFKMNEPAECKWDTKDEDYEIMENHFTCDQSISDHGVIEGYGCEGTLTGVTNETTDTSDYFIRCNDQPWLDTNNPNPSLYSRNANSVSYKYSLRASTPLIMLDLAPKGTVIRTSSETSININSVTSGGGSNGKSECKWKIGGECLGGETSIYSLFSETNSKTHRDSTVNLSEGNCLVEVKCEDDSENRVYENSSFDILIDDESPKVSRAYHFAGVLVVYTNEESECKFTTDEKVNCDFDFDGANTTLMTGVSYRHETNWLEETKYYIKCKDYRGNINPGCGIITRTT